MPTTSPHLLAQISAQFTLQGEAAHFSPLGSGHIHDTYLAKNGQPGNPDYVLQRVNHQIFKNVPALLQNIALVTAHLKDKVSAQGGDPTREVLTLVPTQAGNFYHQDSLGNYWRMYRYLPHTRSYDQVETPHQAFEGGKAFGRFQALLADIDPTRLHPILDRFHDVENRLEQFAQALSQNLAQRKAEVPEEIAFLEARAQQMKTILQLGKAGELPLRVTHNDTKFNNVLLDRHDRAQCVIDLDTVMPGYVAYDFGDAIRTIISTAPEDEPDLSKIHLRLPLFEGFAEGFLQETQKVLMPLEIDSLLEGVFLLPYLMGLRFLTDYLNGDTYYKIHFPTHNLVRARAQFRLIEQLEDHRTVLHSILQQVAQKSKPA
ncbi:MAG: phosphotransferase enzyme family protein [Rufibacter sp.]